MDKDTVLQYGWISFILILCGFLIVGIGPVSQTITEMVHDEIVGDYNYYIIVLDACGGSVSQNRIVAVPGEEYGFLPTPAAQGKTFIGWYTSAEGGVQITSRDEFGVSNGYTLYAHWE